MKISITRSFSKKVQLKQYEPIDVFCGATVEYEKGSLETIANIAAQESEYAFLLDRFCRQEVERTLADIRKPMKESIAGKSKAEKKEIAKDESENDNGNE